MSIKALENHLKPLQPFLETEGVTEVCINRPCEVYVEKNRVFHAHKVETLDYAHLEALAELIAEYNHQTLSPEKPLLSASLLNGERVQCVLPPACEKGNVVMAIRKHRLHDFTLADYTLNQNRKNKKNKAPEKALNHFYQTGDLKNFIKLAVLSKKNMIIAGGTGTGKTTFLNACLKIVPHHERLITLEDTREVVLTQPNAVHLLAARQSVSSVNLQDLFEACLRLRPDRIFLSELRGKEAFAFLRAANSGHPGSITTVHADTPHACFDQLVFMMQQAGSQSLDERLLAYIKKIVPIVIQLKRSEKAEQFVEISEVYWHEQAT